MITTQDTCSNGGPWLLSLWSSIKLHKFLSSRIKFQLIKKVVLTSRNSSGPVIFLTVQDHTIKGIHYLLFCKTLIKRNSQVPLRIPMAKTCKWRGWNGRRGREWEIDAYLRILRDFFAEKLGKALGKGEIQSAAFNGGIISRYWKENREIEDLMADTFIFEPNL